MKSMILIAALVSMALVSSAFFAPSADAEDTSFDLMDVDGNTVHFDAPAKYVVTLGVGYTQTVIDLGLKDKILGVDHYSTKEYTGNEAFDGLENLGNYYNVDGRKQILLTLLQMEDEDINAEDILILAPNYSSIKNETDGLTKLIAKDGLGYKVLMLVGTTTSYDDVTDMVKKIGLAMGVADTQDIVDNMNSVKTEITEKVESEGLSGASVIHVASYDPPRVYNKSMLLSMVGLLEGTNIGQNGTTTNYQTDYPAIVQMADGKGNVVIFLDAGHPLSASEFKDKLGNMDNVRVVKMKPEWNNACPSITEGLQAVATALYPDHFDFNLDDDGGSGDDWYLYLGIGVAIVAVVGILAFFLIRRN